MTTINIAQVPVSLESLFCSPGVAFFPLQRQTDGRKLVKAKRAVVAERQAGAESACLPGTALSARSKGAGRWNGFLWTCPCPNSGILVRLPQAATRRRGGPSLGTPSPLSPRAPGCAAARDLARPPECAEAADVWSRPPGQDWGRGGGEGRAPGAKPPASVSPKPGSDRRETHPRFPVGGSLLSSRQGLPLPSWPPGVCVGTRACGHPCVWAPVRACVRRAGARGRSCRERKASPGRWLAGPELECPCGRAAGGGSGRKCPLMRLRFSVLGLFLPFENCLSRWGFFLEA